jgi:3alpha(or 20beta)-hydroxysteroid dehydrogenase
MNRLQGKVAIVTGAARGQGEITARLFAAEGALVVVTDVLQDEGRAVAKDIGGAATFIAHDVSSEAAWEQVAAEALRLFGHIDILINNAAINYLKPLAATPRADFDKVLAINLVGPFLGMKAVAPQMRQQKSGSIVNISSVNGLRGTTGMSIYDASKWGVRGMTKSLALELAPQGIRVNSVHPGAIDTPMLNPNGDLDPVNAGKEFGIAIGRIGRPSEVAQASLFLASDEASYISGAELAVDGAWTAGLLINSHELDHY